MSLLRPYRLTTVLRTIQRPARLAPTIQARFATGYGDPSDQTHPATANPQDQGSSTQKKQPEHPGPRSNEPSRQGSSSYGDKGEKAKVNGAPTDKRSASGAAETNWDNKRKTKLGGHVSGDVKETVLGGSLSGNKDKTTTKDSEAGVVNVKGDMGVMGEIDPKDAVDAKDVDSPGNGGTKEK